MNLFEIDAAIMACVDEETGEIIDAEKLDSLQMEKDLKVRNIACWIKDLKAEAEVYKNEAATFTARKRAAENKMNSLKEYLDKALDGQKVKAEEFTISYRNVTNGKVVLDNTDKIPPIYLNEPREDWFKKTEIKQALLDGKTVPGAHLEDSHSIIIK